MDGGRSAIIARFHAYPRSSDSTFRAGDGIWLAKLASGLHLVHGKFEEPFDLDHLIVDMLILRCAADR